MYQRQSERSEDWGQSRPFTTSSTQHAVATKPASGTTAQPRHAQRWRGLFWSLHQEVDAFV